MSHITLAGMSTVRITGSDYEDTIYGVASGNETIRAGGGADNILLGNGHDTIAFQNTADGGSTGDVISSFVSADDMIRLDMSLAGDGSTLAGDASAPAAFDLTGSAGGTRASIGTVVDTANTGAHAVSAAELTNTAEVAAQLNTAFQFVYNSMASGGTTGTFAFAIEASDTPGTFGVYAWTQSADCLDSQIDAGELKILGVVTGDDFTAGDIAFVSPAP